MIGSELSEADHFLTIGLLANLEPLNGPRNPPAPCL